MKLNYLVLLPLLFVMTLTSQQVNYEKLDSLFTLLEKNNKAMGSIAVSKNGKIVYTRAIGYTKIDGGFKLQSDESTRYRIGSITKMFTAVLTFQLIEAGKLKLSTKLSAYYPEIKNAKTITISHLLNHRSGIHNFTDDTTYFSYMEKEKTHAEMIDIIKKGGSDFIPDTKASYSNSNFVMLGYILEKIYKQAYPVIVKEHIVQKIALENTYVGGKINTRDNECHSFFYDSIWHKAPETDMSIPQGAGSIVSTPSDLTKFIEALFTGKLISKTSLNTMITIKDKYGMGIFQTPFYERTGYGHTGGIDGFASALSYFPNDSLSVAYTGNGVKFPVNEILVAALSSAYNKTYVLPVFSSYVVTSAELNKYLGLYANKGIPIQLNVTKVNNILQVTGTGQPTIDLDPFEKDKFKFEEAGVILHFNPDKKEVVLFQNGMEIKFLRTN
jgi:D-alanyl-D-alanine carboxypeptidase